jgi:hypothetical protein
VNVAIGRWFVNFSFNVLRGLGFKKHKAIRGQLVSAEPVLAKQQKLLWLSLG